MNQHVTSRFRFRPRTPFKDVLAVVFLDLVWLRSPEEVITFTTSLYVGKSGCEMPLCFFIWLLPTQHGCLESGLAGAKPLQTSQSEEGLASGHVTWVKPLYGTRTKNVLGIKAHILPRFLFPAYTSSSTTYTRIYTQMADICDQYFAAYKAR